jgi:adenylosuccinate synthase
MTSNNITVVGLQWGDEGKGKVVDAVARTCRYVSRFCGGANAGHTVQAGGQKYAMHLIPCGILHDGVINVIGNGVAFDPAVAWEEISALRARGVTADPSNLMVSSTAQVVMPWHRLEDRLREQDLGRGKIGTTARGIGPCYADKAHRTTAVRAADLAEPDRLREKIRTIGAAKNRLFAALYDAEPIDLDAMETEYLDLARNVGPMVRNTGAMLRQACADGERILFEGGQGSMLDVDHGTYPFVTSSSVSACGVPSGAGIPPSQVGTVIGLIKAYATRVGAGPFPSEQDNETGQYLRDRGNEYGTTTGRPRRCGWFDAFAARYAADLSGVDEFALSLLDVLSGLDEIQVCTGYRIDGKTLEAFDPAVMDRAECVYETLPGWKEEITDCERIEDLPEAARAYVDRIEALLARPVGIVSVGPDREQTIFHHTHLESLK